MGGLAVGFHPGRRIRRSGDRCFYRRRNRRIGLKLRRLYRARGRMVMLIVGVLVVSMFMLMIVMIMMFRAAVVMSAVVGVGVQIFGVQIFGVQVFGVQLFRVQAFGAFRAFMRPGGLRRIGACVLDDLALDALAIAAAARVAVARPAAVGAVFALLLGLAMGAFVCFDQRLAIGDRDLIIVRMDFAEGEKAVAVATVLDEGRLQRRLYPRDLGEIDVAAQLFALGGLEIKLFDAIAADHDNPGLFRVGSIDQHFVGHFGTHGGGGRVQPGARIARPGDATVHLIRG
ncbi:MAG TPA: hypothetical protein VGA15_04165 [Bradyrhizobium sp.]